MVDSMDQFVATLAQSTARLARENAALRAKVKRLKRAMRWMQVCLTSLRDTYGAELKHLDASIDADRKRLDALEARRCND